MSEGWEDCPVLPVGWKRREVYRRSGATIGKSDTYYMSPTAERFRSKVELVKYFGDSLDLTYFDFKKGLILPPSTKIRKAVKRPSTTSCDGEEQDWQPTPKKKVKVTESHSPIEVKMEKDSTTESLASDPLDTLIVCCEDCQQWVPGVMFGARKRRFKFYCAECRARRRELGRKLNYYKRFGCGECDGCTVMEDCGICRGCMVRNTNPTKNWKCVKRRCQKLKEIKAEASYRDTVGKPKKEISAEASYRDTVGKPKKEIKAEASYRDTVGKPKKKMKVPFQALKKAMKKVKSESQVEKKFPKKIKTPPIIKAEVIAEEKPCPPIEEEEIQEPPIELVQMPEGARGSPQAGADSPHSSLDTAEQKVISIPPEGSAKGDGSTHRSPGIKARTQAKAFNLNNFLSVMKPFLKPPSSSKGHERPSVIKETNSEQTQSQPLEAAGVRSQTASSVAKRDTSRSDSERIPIARSVSETESTSHRLASPLIKQRDSRERHASRKTAPISSEEAGVQDLSIRAVTPMIHGGDAEPASTTRPSVSPKRPAEPEVRTSGVPSNSRIIRGVTPEQNPGYGRSTPTAGEAGQSVPPQSLEESNPGDDSSLPVITQIFSLGSPYMMMTLEPLLRNFMQELMVMPLPASWVVCSSLGPDVQLIQLSRKSLVSDAVVQIRPGFFFHVLVRGLPVPLGHRLYRSHPAQLTTVDDVVDLISDLETYRVCAGYPQLRNAKAPPAAVAALLPRERSSYCEVLVDKERCFQCGLTL